MATLYLFVVNTITVDGRRLPNIPAETQFVGHIYQKTGNVYKYLIKTPSDLTGQPGVFGPLTQSQVQAALDADDAQNLHGFIVDEVPDWAFNGDSTVFGVAYNTDHMRVGESVITVGALRTKVREDGEVRPSESVIKVLNF